MNDQLQDATTRQQTRAYAAWYGVQVGLCWIISYGLILYGLSEPLAGHFGLFTGISSLPLAIWLMRQFRDQIAELPIGRAWHMALMIYLCASLLLALGQYIYFAYIDGGYMAREYSEILTNPEYRPMLESMLPNENYEQLTNDLVTTLSTISPAKMAVQMMPISLLISFFLAIPTTFLSFTKPKTKG
ncbi:MAG: DUF4199 domain-containing protein [Bacteroidaceae bacterium]|nr:DUF4199 domain-containing protein [Bacteroidaceae bacterium]